MKLLERTPGDHDLDQLLRAFYKAELPEPFPVLKAPRARPAPVVSWSLLRNRAALAASVCLLLVGGWLLAGRTTDIAPPSNAGGDSGSASRFDPFGKPASKTTGQPSPGKDCCNH